MNYLLWMLLIVKCESMSCQAVHLISHSFHLISHSFHRYHKFLDVDSNKVEKTVKGYGNYIVVTLEYLGTVDKCSDKWAIPENIHTPSTEEMANAPPPLDILEQLNGIVMVEGGGGRESTTSRNKYAIGDQIYLSKTPIDNEPNLSIN